MLKKIKIFLLSRRKFAEEKERIWKQEAENSRLAKNILAQATPEVVIEKIMKRGIEWFDYEDLPMNQRKEYYNDIQAVITNKSFINELNHLIADQVEYIARESRNHEETMNIRMTINAIDLIKQRLENIPDPIQKQPSMDEINEVI